MFVIEDFTGLSEGERVASEGLVSRCPRCGRNGIRHSSCGAVWFVHTQLSRILAEGMRVEPTDCCTSESNVA
jgi:hypothetical protein